MNLIVVESPNKIKTIKSYLNDNYEVLATYGHLREMDKKNGYDKKTFYPNWSIISDSKTSKTKIINDIIKASKKANKIYLATDPDREGEAISWHVYDMLDDENKQKCRRITFNEITEKAIKSSIENAHDINMNLVYSQFARRVMDRLIGYKLSNFVRKTTYGKSAGRVQSVALMFIVNRQLERDRFIPSKWYEINATLENGLKVQYFDLDNKFEPYSEQSSSKYNFKFANEQDAKLVSSQLTDEFIFSKFLSPKTSKGDSYQPLTTDKLLQLGGTVFGYSAEKTTLIAQKLFEGIEVNGEHIAFITYPRTDSIRLNDDFIVDSQLFLRNKYGDSYVNAEYSVKKTKKQKQENVQDAHEAIRPIDPTMTPNKIRQFVDDATYNLYNLIWTRTMICFMSQPVFETTGMIFENNGHNFYTKHKKVIHEGYLILDYYKKQLKEFENEFPNLVLQNKYLGTHILEEFDKQPPPYFTQATLISALKESGVGRPSTYATMAKIGKTRGYVNEQKQKLIPTDIGMKVIEELRGDFSDLIDAKFTSSMESNLDEIAKGDKIWENYLQEFAPQFNEKIKEVIKIKKEEKMKNQVETGRDCPECGSPLVIKKSRFGTEFVACSSFPKCRYAEFDKTSNETNEDCPQCGQKLVKRYSKKNNSTFIGCSGYPNCNFTKTQ